MCSFSGRQENVSPRWLVVMVGKQAGKCKILFKKLIFSTISYLRNWFALVIHPLYLDIYLRGLTGQFSIEGKILTYSALIFYIEATKKRLSLCLKMWRFGNLDDGVYDTTTPKKRTDYIVDGFQFNRRFAPGVYLGIALIRNVNDQHIIIKQFISQFEKIKQIPSKKYAVVMKRLPDEWHLDGQLERGLLDSPETMDFLAQEVARMHKMLDISPIKKMGEPLFLEQKLKDNLALLDKIDYLKDKKKEKKSAQGLLLAAFKANKKYFEARWQNENIKRCHGDLKPGNLWIQPAEQRRPARLLALDCIDFNRPDFCHIDTLCDVAMLAIGLEHSFALRLQEEEGQEREKKGQKLLEHFLNTYLACMHEDKKSVLFLLDYYMAEKAIVCAYTSEVYDHLPSQIVDIYFKLASTHVEKLAKWLPNPIEQQAANRSEDMGEQCFFASDNNDLLNLQKEKLAF